MNAISLYIIMGINLYTNFGINNITFRSDKPKVSPYKTQPQQDCFIRESKDVYFGRRLEQLFPNGELDRTFNIMCEELKLDYKPDLNLVVPLDGNAGGGYAFLNHTITLSLEDCLGSDTKLYGIKDGEKQLQITEQGMPVMTNKVLASYIAQNPQAAKNKGLDKIVAEPATDEEVKKLFLQKLYHELVHAKQHMIMRQTEGIGAKEIISAWRHLPKNQNKPNIDKVLNKLYKQSYWVNKSTPIKYEKDSEQGVYAYNCLDAVKNYAPVESEEYKTNYMEVDAYKSSADYVNERYGEWS